MENENHTQILIREFREAIKKFEIATGATVEQVKVEHMSVAVHGHGKARVMTNIIVLMEGSN
jgi:phytoene dehydrogenase-like protein